MYELSTVTDQKANIIKKKNQLEHIEVLSRGGRWLGTEHFHSGVREPPKSEAGLFYNDAGSIHL